MRGNLRNLLRSSYAAHRWFHSPVASLFCAAFIAMSMYLLSLATRTIPVGTAYAVWVGIGAVGTAIYGMIALGEDSSLLRMLCFGLIIAGIGGLKLLSHE